MNGAEACAARPSAEPRRCERAKEVGIGPRRSGGSDLGVLFQTAMAAFDAALAEVKTQHRHPDVRIGLKEKFRRMGADEWDALRERFRMPAAAEKARVKSAAE